MVLASKTSVRMSQTVRPTSVDQTPDASGLVRVSSVLRVADALMVLVSPLPVSRTLAHRVKSVTLPILSIRTV